MKRLILTIIVTFSLAVNAFSQENKVGEIVAGFTLKDTEDDNVSITDSSGTKGYIIIFTCNECPYSRKYEARIIALNKKYAPLGYPVIAINPSDPNIVPAESQSNMKERADKMSYAFPYLSDAHQNVYPKFAASMVTPTAYILKHEDKELVIKYAGAIDDNVEKQGEDTEKYVESAVNTLLAGRNPSVNFTKPVGCPVREP
jgi:peroxiredoxin